MWLNICACLAFSIAWLQSAITQNVGETTNEKWLITPTACYHRKQQKMQALIRFITYKQETNPRFTAFQTFNQYSCNTRETKLHTTQGSKGHWWKVPAKPTSWVRCLPTQSGRVPFQMCWSVHNSWRELVAESGNTNDGSHSNVAEESVRSTNRPCIGGVGVRHPSAKIREIGEI